MAKKVTEKTEGQQRSIQNLRPFKKGQSGNPSGRPKKYISLLKDRGYKLAEVNDTIQTLTSMSVTELEEVDNNAEATILEKIVAKAMLKGYASGSLYNLETLLTRVYGQPKQSMDLSAEIKQVDLSTKSNEELNLLLKAKKIIGE